jgi:hypothetical protein
MNASTIWNNVNKFFAVTPTIEMFKTHLGIAEPPETSIQLGPHYSISVNQKLKSKFRNGNVQLRLPQTLVETPEQTEISPTVVFHRLLSAFVMSDELTHKPTRSTSDDMGHKPRAAPKFSKFSASQFPVNFPGTSSYSLLPFEQKLMLEVKCLGLVPDVTVPRLTDNEVMNDIMERNKELNEWLRRSNELRRIVMAELEKKEYILKERAELARNWATAVPKTEPTRGKEQKRPKKRDKLI